MSDRASNGVVVQFAIPARDPRRTAAFYHQVFGWKTESFVVPRETGTDEVHVVEGLGARDGDLRARIESPGMVGSPISGFECTIAVDSVEAIAAAVLASGGTVLEQTPFIPGVGGRLRFADPEGNTVTAMQFADT